MAQRNKRLLYGWSNADKASLFALSGFELSSPCKMKLKNTGKHAIYNYFSYGPTFGHGHDLHVASTVRLNSGCSYECGPFEQNGGQAYNIKEMEVFKVTNNTPSIQNSRMQQTAYLCHPVKKSQLSIHSQRKSMMPSMRSGPSFKSLMRRCSTSKKASRTKSNSLSHLEARRHQHCHAQCQRDNDDHITCYVATL